MSHGSNAPTFLLTKETQPFTEGWQSEAAFDKWLVSEDGLERLQAATHIEIDPESISQQESVGGFSADIVAEDTEGKRVVIENQRGKTDHDHLGKLLTYADGLAAGAGGCHLVWIAENIRGEHRAALDWLNNQTGDDVNFFGLEIKLLKVMRREGQPQEGVGLLPEFKVVSRPNDWVRESKKIEGKLSPKQEKQRAFWSKVVEKNSLFQDRSLPKGHYFEKYAGHSGCTWNLDFLQGEIRVNLTLQKQDREHNKFIFDHIKQHHQAEVEAAFGAQLQWDRKDDVNRSMIVYTQDVAGEGWNEDKWDDFVDWLDVHINKLKDALDAPLQEAVDALKNEF